MPFRKAAVVTDVESLEPTGLIAPPPSVAVHAARAACTIFRSLAAIMTPVRSIARSFTPSVTEAGRSARLVRRTQLAIWEEMVLIGHPSSWAPAGRRGLLRYGVVVETEYKGKRLTAAMLRRT